MPGGRVHAGESTLDAIKRELVEELDLDGVSPILLKVSEQFFMFDDKKYHELNFVYYVNLEDDNKLSKSDNVKNLDNKNETMIWIDKNTLDKYKILPEFIYNIKDDKPISHLIFSKLK